jgi:hypothetical protein
VPTQTTSDVVAIQNCNSLTTGSALSVEANGSSNADDNSVVKVLQEHASADKTVGIYVHQDGDDAHIEFAGAGGGGIKFNASAMSSSDANTLDDYEEGTWSPVVSDGSNAMTMHGSYDTGYYTKVGNMVHVTGYLQTTSIGSASGDIRITGLPFTVVNNTAGYSGGSVGYAVGLSITAGNTVTCSGQINQTYVDLRTWDATAGTTNMQASEWTDDGAIIFNFSYRAA